MRPIVFRQAASGGTATLHVEVIQSRLGWEFWSRYYCVEGTVNVMRISHLLVRGISGAMVRLLLLNRDKAMAPSRGHPHSGFDSE